MSTATTPPPDGSPGYEIRLKGHLDARWADWFDGLDLTNESDGTTTLRGPVVDQAALHGVLQRLRDVGLPLVSVTPLQEGRPDLRADRPHPPLEGTTP